MIKITADPKVLAALQKAFPRPTASAERALNKYIAALESLIFKSLQVGQTPQQKKLKLYGISLDVLANSGGRIGPKKQRTHAWLRENNLALVETVILGSKFNSEVSSVKFTNLATLTNTLKVNTQIVNTTTSDAVIDQYLGGDESSNWALFNYLYPEYRFDWPEAKRDEVFDLVPVDIDSLKNYVVWLTTLSKKLNQTKQDLALRQALTIIGVASVADGYYFQRKKPSKFGRMYYEGTSVQNVNKELRAAMLGNCWEYDIRSSVVAWKMGFAQSYLLKSCNKKTVRMVFPNTLLYLEDKRDFMVTVKHYVFPESSPVSKELQPHLLKQAFTAISFGARATASGWQNSGGVWTNPALVNIIKNSEDRSRFLEDPAVQGFIKEQGLLDNFIFESVQNHTPEILLLPEVQTSSTRASKSKVVAYLYQHGETEVMDILRDAAKEHARHPIANVHDAIFFKRKLGADLKSEIEICMREQTGNPYWRLAASELKRYEPRLLDAKLEEQAHKDRIAAEEARALKHFGDAQSSDGITFIIRTN